ncbi:helix-turn-helix domain-containing protein [Cupriavidus sp. CuC1]|uniref:helix-turn-helix domain-containing protein n=1 Tax=Cupriavidus sp. CuC1 TaxID=3373131 RepID=UPI0037D3DE7C
MSYNCESDLTGQLAELGARIRKARDFRRLTLYGLANQSGVCVQTLISIEQGNSGVAAPQLHKVLRTLGLPQTLVPQDVPPGQREACHSRHLGSVDTETAINNAAQKACEVLDAWLVAINPGQAIDSNFQRHLREHIAAMLCGRPGSMRPARIRRRVYSDDFVGGPIAAESEDCRGWALRVRGETLILQGQCALDLNDAAFEPYSSREVALRAFREYVEKGGIPPEALDAVPVFWSESGQYYF